ncbi:MAG: Stp1/IreP family PP2C-type Ser/Thr phosphatase [Bacteroidales bacterium]|nr:Stp1/IreP family PP2C-type Ser/Thr phosphatase [Bacteroidales bacterium]
MGKVNFDSDVCALTDTGLVRTHNEDANRFCPTVNGDLFVVCDGMGGHAGGAHASNLAVESICRYISGQKSSNPGQCIAAALEYANTRVYDEACRRPALKGMGTTACVALVCDGKMWYAHVGDSRIYYYNNKSKTLYRLTKDHSVVQALVDQGIITEAEAEHHPEKNKIRKSLGIKETVEPQLCRMPLIPAQGDVVLLCSDGLSGMIDEKDILEVLATAGNINHAAKTLVELAKSGGGNDNITVQLIRFSNADSENAVFEAVNRGVSLKGNSVAAGTRRKTVWPWVLITVSAIAILIAGMLLVNNDEKVIPPASVAMPSGPATVNNEAYKEELRKFNIPENAYTDDNDGNGRTFRFYKRPENNDGDLIVFPDNEYSTGHFDFRAGGGYDPYNGKNIKNFKRDGSPR